MLGGGVTSRIWGPRLHPGPNPLDSSCTDDQDGAGSGWEGHSGNVGACIWQEGVAGGRIDTAAAEVDRVLEAAKGSQDGRIADDQPCWWWQRLVPRVGAGRRKAEQRDRRG